MNRQGQDGRFIPKGDSPRSLRSMRLTDAAWEGLRQIAEADSLSRTDVIERFALGGLSLPEQPSIDPATIEPTIERVLADPSVVRPRDRAAVRRGAQSVFRELRERGVLDGL